MVYNQICNGNKISDEKLESREILALFLCKKTRKERLTTLPLRISKATKQNERTILQKRSRNGSTLKGCCQRTAYIDVLHR